MKQQSPEVSIQGRKSAFTIGKRDFQWYSLIVFVSIVIYFASQVLLAHYIYGDQVYYINFYHALKGVAPSHVIELQFVHTGSAEPLYGYTSWLFANLGFEKNTFIALANFALTLVVGLALKNSGAKPIIFLLVVTNFYFVVLLTSAERLKFAYIFFALMFATSGKMRIVCALIAPLFHFQTLINYASLFLGRFFELRVEDYKKKSTLLRLFALTMIAVLCATYFLDTFGDALFAKFEHYSSEQRFEINDFGKIVGLFIVGLGLGIRVSTLFAYILPIAVSVAILGPERVNMVGFVMIFIIAAKNDKLMNGLIILLLSYFSFKTIDYVDNVFAHGNGFL